MEYQKVIANSTETFRFRHLLIQEKIDIYQKKRSFDDEKWAAADFHLSEIYRSVHWLCRLRLDKIIEKGIFYREWHMNIGRRINTQTVIVKILEKTIVTANIYKLRNHIHVKYWTRNRTCMMIGKQGLYNHYADCPVIYRHQYKMIRQRREERNPTTSIGFIEGWFETMMLSDYRKKKFYRRLIWKA